jgi:hypothetical protein
MVSFVYVVININININTRNQCCIVEEKEEEEEEEEDWRCDFLSPKSISIFVDHACLVAVSDQC